MKFNFNLIEIFTQIEETRLKFGLVFSKYLENKFQYFCNFLKSNFHAKDFLKLGLLSIFFTSIFIRSTFDIGVDSGFSLEVSQKILEGKKFYDDFIEYNFPLTFILLTPAVIIAKFFDITPIIIAEFYINFIGLLSIIWSYKILKKSKQVPLFIINLLILCFAIGFFLRYPTLTYNEFLTKTSFTLAIIYPLFCYNLVGIDNLNLKQKITLGILMAMVVSIKPFNLLIFVFFEIYRIWKSKKLTDLFVIHNYIFGLFSILYLVILWVFFRTYLENIFYLFELYNKYRQNYLNMQYVTKFTYLLTGFSSYFVMCFFYLRMNIKNNYFDKILILGFSALIHSFFESFYLDQIAVFYALFLPLITIGFYHFYKEYRSFIIRHLLSIILAIAILSLFLDFSLILSIILNALLVLMILLILINNHFKFIQKMTHYFKNFIIIIVIVGFAGFCGKFFRNIAYINFINIAIESNLRTPNDSSNELIKIVKKYNQDNKDIITLNFNIFDSYPSRNYLKLPNNFRILQYDIFLSVLKSPLIHKMDEKYYKIARDDFLNQLRSPNTKLIINNFFEVCNISILEYFLRDEEIKKVFTEKFQFLSTAKTIKENDMVMIKYTKEYLNDDEFEIVKQIQKLKPQYLFYDNFETYIRK